MKQVIRAGRWGKQLRLDFETGPAAMAAFHTVAKKKGWSLRWLRKNDPNPGRQVVPLPRRVK